MKSLSRNLPVTLLVGSAGFIGSHLTDKLLSKGLQLVGVDDLTSGSLDNLTEAKLNHHFQFINQSMADSLQFERLERLDYAVFVVSETLPSHKLLAAVDNFLRVCQGFKPKILFVSSINLYDNRQSSTLKEAEGRVAKFAAEHKLNARVVRLAAVYGPRMHWREGDPMVKLIQAAVKGELQKENSSLDFTTRAIYIKDAVSLLEKSLFHGATAQKIFDGCLLHPIKVAEVKQILLDPLWHENTNFSPAHLPPWPTPNLARTEGELNWQPATPVATALKETVEFFKQYPDRVGEKSQDIGNRVEDLGEERLPTTDYRLPPEDLEKAVDSSQSAVRQPPKLDLSPITSPIKKYTPLVAGTALIVYALIVPLVNLAVGSWVIKDNLNQVVAGINRGEFAQAQEHLSTAQAELTQVEEIQQNYVLFKVLSSAGIRLGGVEDLVKLERGLVEASAQGVEASRSLTQAWGAFTGTNDSDVLGVSQSSQTGMSALISSLGSLESLNKLSWLDKLGLGPDYQALKSYARLASQLGSLASVLTEVSQTQGSYLVVLVDDRSLRPGGGQPVAISQIDVKAGRVEKVTTKSVSELDKNLTEVVEPPVELRKDTLLKSWSLKEVMVEADFISNSQNILWFYQKSTGVKPLGVVAINRSSLTEVFGDSPTDEAGAKQSLERLVNNLLYVPQKELVDLGLKLQTEAAKEGIRLYFVDPGLQTLAAALGWQGGVTPDKFGLVESDIKSSGISQQIKRQIMVKPKLEKGSKLTVTLEISYINPHQEVPYENRLKLYTPQGWRLVKAEVNNQSVFEQLTNLSDYNLAGYSYLLKVLPKEQKTLSWQLERVGESEILNYTFGLFKQSGVPNSPLSVSMEYPQDLGVVNLSGDGQRVGTKINWESQLDQDQSFTVNFKKLR